AVGNPPPRPRHFPDRSAAKKIYSSSLQPRLSGLGIFNHVSVLQSHAHERRAERSAVFVAALECPSTPSLRAILSSCRDMDCFAGLAMTWIWFRDRSDVGWVERSETHRGHT